MSSDDEDQAAVDMLEPGERLNHVAHRTIQRKQQAMLAERRCPICWISHERCICPFFSKQQIPHRFLVLLHHHEFGKASNTGKLVALNLTESKLLVLGQPDSGEAAAIDELRAQSPNSCILFPSKTAISIKDLIATRREPLVPLTICVCDGTWSQARSLERRLPDTIPRIRLDPDLPSQFLLRKQTQSDRISTIESVELLLRELGLPEQADHLSLIFKKFIVAMVEKRGLHPDTVLENAHFLERLSLKHNRQTHRQAPVVQRPLMACPLCGDSDRRFRNKGPAPEAARRRWKCRTCEEYFVA